MAKTVARMLNAQVIGGKKGDRWRDDIWTMKYLSGFKWEMLGEQVGEYGSLQQFLDGSAVSCMQDETSGTRLKGTLRVGGVDGDRNDSGVRACASCSHGGTC